jgi:hypothetical protein
MQAYRGAEDERFEAVVAVSGLRTGGSCPMLKSTVVVREGQHSGSV